MIDYSHVTTKGASENSGGELVEHNEPYNVCHSTGNNDVHRSTSNKPKLEHMGMR